MRVISLNANGIRSAARRGFFAWAASQAADVICLQETRAQEHQLPAEAIAVLDCELGRAVSAEAENCTEKGQLRAGDDHGRAGTIWIPRDASCRLTSAP